MRKSALTAAAAGALLLSACTMMGSIAPGVRPEAEIAGITLAVHGGEPGFNVALLLRHHGSQPLTAQGLRIDIMMNGRSAASQERDLSTEVPGGEELPLNIFVPANQLSPLGRESLATTRMLIVELSAAATVFFDGDDPHSSLNPTASFDGVAGYEL